MAYGFKTGGRQKGTLNKSTQQGRENFQIILADEAESGRIQEALHQLSPKDYIAAILKMVPFALPKAQPAEYMEAPRAANEQLAIEGAEMKKEKEKKKPVEDTEPSAPTAEEIERFRITTGWSYEQMDRYLRGESMASINKNP